MCSKGQPISEGVEMYKPNQTLNNCHYSGRFFVSYVYPSLQPQNVTVHSLSCIQKRMGTTKRKFGKGLRSVLPISLATNNYAHAQESSLSSSSSYFFLPLFCYMSSTDPSCFSLAIQTASSMCFHKSQTESIWTYFIIP